MNVIELKSRVCFILILEVFGLAKFLSLQRVNFAQQASCFPGCCAESAKVFSCTPSPYLASGGPHQVLLHAEFSPLACILPLHFPVFHVVVVAKRMSTDRVYYDGVP